jgi:hypothetical protein
MLMAHIDFKENIDLRSANQVMLKVIEVFKKEYQIFEVTLQPEFDYADDKSLIVKGGEH